MAPNFFGGKLLNEIHVILSGGVKENHRREPRKAIPKSGFTLAEHVEESETICSQDG